MERIVGIAEAASKLGVSITTLRRWEASDKLVAEHTTGGHRPYDLSIFLNYGLSCFGPPTEQSARRLATAVCHPTIKNPILSGKSKSWNFSVPGKAGRLTAGETRELANGCADRELLPARL